MGFPGKFNSSSGRMKNSRRGGFLDFTKKPLPLSQDIFQQQHHHRHQRQSTPFIRDGKKWVASKHNTIHTHSFAHSHAPPRVLSFAHCYPQSMMSPTLPLPLQFQADLASIDTTYRIDDVLQTPRPRKRPGPPA